MRSHFMTLYLGNEQLADMSCSLQHSEAKRGHKHLSA